jgi:hypothetical protein
MPISDHCLHLEAVAPGAIYFLTMCRSYPFERNTCGHIACRLLSEASYFDVRSAPKANQETTRLERMITITGSSDGRHYCL